LLRSLAKALREEAYAVDTAAAGDEGLHLAENVDYDAVVLDVMLPRLDGWQVLKRLRKQKRTPVLMLTARDATPDRVRGLDAGADDYLVKPFDLSELLARLRAVIRRAAGKARSRLEIGDLAINLGARSVTRAGEPITLSLEADDFSALFQVADTGEGISAEDLPHLFERFYHAHKSRSHAEVRNGLGLAISKAIVDAHGGAIEVSSQVGVGSAFTVKLPLKPRPDENHQRRSSA
jgi:two-component system OmpR family response regulator